MSNKGYNNINYMTIGWLYYIVSYIIYIYLIYYNNNIYVSYYVDKCNFIYI